MLKFNCPCKRREKVGETKKKLPLHPVGGDDGFFGIFLSLHIYWRDFPPEWCCIPVEEKGRDGGGEVLFIIQLLRWNKKLKVTLDAL